MRRGKFGDFLGLLSLKGPPGWYSFFLILLWAILMSISVPHAWGNDNDEARNYLKVGDILSDPQDRLEYYTKAIELDPTLSDAYHNRGYIYFSLGESELDLQDYERALELSPDMPWYLNSRGVVYNALFEPDRSIVDLSRAIELDASIDLLYINRGISHIMLGEYRQAEDDLQIGIKKGYDRDYALLLLYIARALSGDLTGAKETLGERAEELTSDDWINPVIMLYGGVMDRERMLSSARDEEQEMEGKFYLGAWYYFGGERELAEGYLRECLESEIYDFVEYTLANWMVSILLGVD